MARFSGFYLFFLFQDSVYWTDWNKEAVMKTNKFSGKGVQSVVTNINNPMDIQVYHQVRQPQEENHCAIDHGGCSHLCLRAPHLSDNSARITCKCPTGMNLLSDEKTCDGVGKCYYEK